MFFSSKMMLCNNPDAGGSFGMTGPVPYPGAVTMWDCLGYNVSKVALMPDKMVVSNGCPVSWTEAECVADNRFRTVDMDWPGPKNTSFKPGGHGGSSGGVMWPRADKLNKDGQLIEYANPEMVAGCTVEACLQQHQLGTRQCTHLQEPMCEC